MANNKLALPTEDEGLIFSEGEDGKLNITGTTDDLREMLGTSSRHAGGIFFQQILNIVDPTGKNSALYCNAIVPLLKAIEPADELETMLAVQMIGTHTMAMEMMRRGMQADATSAVDSCTNRVTKLSRTFAAQMEALNKHRGRGQQKMTVEHVHVNEGAQAVIGSVGGGKK